jgi:long-subunit fatty acid transport protein
MHRASGMDIPDAPITHHWLDSTHITFGVVTAGFVSGNWKIEASQFTGREPDQNRYDFDTPKFDSTAVRLSWNPDENWSLQASWGYLKSPEQLEPDLNENRFTASATYVKPLGENSSFAATLAWGLKKESNGTDLNGVIAEAEYKPAELWTLFTRAEWVQNSELDALGRKLEASQITVGGIKDWRVDEHWKFGVGALYAFDFAPHAVPGYGGNPHGTMAFVRVVAD